MRGFDYDFLVDGMPILLSDEGVEISKEDLDSDESGRDESGVMHRIVLREKVIKCVVPYASLTQEEYSYIVSLFAKKPNFEVNMLDLDGQRVIFTAYCPKVGVSVQNRRTGLYKNFKLSITQC